MKPHLPFTFRIHLNHPKCPTGLCNNRAGLVSVPPFAELLFHIGLGSESGGGVVNDMACVCGKGGEWGVPVDSVLSTRWTHVQLAFPPSHS